MEKEKTLLNHLLNVHFRYNSKPQCFRTSLSFCEAIERNCTQCYDIVSRVGVGVGWTNMETYASANQVAL